MHERDSRSGSPARATANRTLKGPAASAVPWHPPVAPRPMVPAPPPPSRRPSATLKQGFGLSQEPSLPSFDEPEADAERTRAWRHTEGREPVQLWTEDNPEPTVTTSVKQFEIEEVREQLQREQERKVSMRRAPHPSTVQTQRILATPGESGAQPQGRSVVRWLTALALLAFIGAGAFAQHHGYHLPSIDVSRFEVPEYNFQPLWSGLEKAQDVLRTQRDKLFPSKEVSAHASSPALAKVTPPVAETPVPTVEQLQVDTQEGTNLSLPLQSSLSSGPADVAPALEGPSVAIAEGGDPASNEEAAAKSAAPAEEALAETGAKRAPRARGKGVLRINSLPWAEIYVDGELLGHTPETRLELSAGRHEITLKNAEQNLLKTFLIHIQPGRVLTRIVHLRDEPKADEPKVEEQKAAEP